MLLDFITIRLLDILDIFLVAVLMYQLYRLIRGTVAMSIFVGLVSFYFLWIVVKSFHMELLSSILGQFIGVGVLAVIIVFQQEIRRFLLIFGTRYFTKNKHFSLSKLLKMNYQDVSMTDMEAITESLFVMASTKTGALIVLTPVVDLTAIIETGEELDASINSNLLQAIFTKESLLHDGAVVIVGDRIKGAKCVLPTTERSDLPVNFGMRHRSAIGMSEETNTIILVVSEQTGNVSYCLDGQIHKVDSKSELLEILQKKMTSK